MEFRAGSFVAKHHKAKGLLELVHDKEWNSSEFRAGLHIALNYAAVHAIKHFALDLSFTQCLDDENEGWLLGAFLPQMMLQLGSENYLALVLPPECFDELLLRVGEVGLRSYNTFVIINTFCDRSKALAWLEEGHLESAS